MENATQRPAIVTEAHLVFLDDLRESGATNMFGARPYLVEAFGLSKSDASQVLSYWMQSFEERHAPCPVCGTPDSAGPDACKKCATGR